MPSVGLAGSEKVQLEGQVILMARHDVSNLSGVFLPLWEGLRAQFVLSCNPHAPIWLEQRTELRLLDTKNGKRDSSV